MSLRPHSLMFDLPAKCASGRLRPTARKMWNRNNAPRSARALNALNVSRGFFAVTRDEARLYLFLESWSR